MRLKRNIFIWLTALFCAAGFSFCPKGKSASYQLIVFEGSDWCARCKLLNRQVFADSSFQSFLKQQNVELIRIDFPQHNKLSQEIKLNNEKIAEKYKFNGTFPTLVLSRSDTFNYTTLQNLDYNSTELRTEILHKFKLLE